MVIGLYLYFCNNKSITFLRTICLSICQVKKNLLLLLCVIESSHHCLYRRWRDSRGQGWVWRHYDRPLRRLPRRLPHRGRGRGWRIRSHHYKANLELLFTQSLTYMAAIIAITKVPVFHSLLGYTGMFIVSRVFGIISVMAACCLPRQLSVQHPKKNNIPWNKCQNTVEK